MSSADFLVEIGTEELPPKALRSLMEAFASGLEAAVDESRLGHGDLHAYASPRRLAVLINDLDLHRAVEAHRGRAAEFVLHAAAALDPVAPFASQTIRKQPPLLRQRMMRGRGALC